MKVSEPSIRQVIGLIFMVFLPKLDTVNTRLVDQVFEYLRQSQVTRETGNDIKWGKTPMYVDCEMAVQALVL